MPIYFNDVAPFCPISRDEPTGMEKALSIRTSIPAAHDLKSAIAAVNIASTIIHNIISNRVINNVFNPAPPAPRKTPPDQTINKLRYSRWKQSGPPTTNKYKYYRIDENGNRDPNVWVMMERIERITWTDPAWQTSLTFAYGDKGEGEPQ